MEKKTRNWLIVLGALALALIVTFITDKVNRGFVLDDNSPAIARDAAEKQREAERKTGYDSYEVPFADTTK